MFRNFENFESGNQTTKQLCFVVSKPRFEVLKVPNAGGHVSTAAANVGLYSNELVLWNVENILYRDYLRDYVRQLRKLWKTTRLM